jgi:hypothetical protein
MRVAFSHGSRSPMVAVLDATPTWLSSIPPSMWSGRKGN